MALDAVWWHQYGLDKREDYTSITYVEVGALVAYEWAAYVVVDKRPLPEEQWPANWIENRQANRQAWAYETQAWAITLRPQANVIKMDKRADVRRACLRRSYWRVLPEHYSVCAKCGDLQPCREEVQAAQAARAMKEMVRFEMAGICPACQKPVSSRQRSLTFPDNLFVPAGPPVTYHVGRRECVGHARVYERLWVEADPARRRASLPEPPQDGTWRIQLPRNP